MKDEETFKRLEQELDVIEKQKAKNKLLVEKSEYEFLKSVLKEKQRKETQHTRAATYTVFTVIGFLICPPFGILLTAFFIADAIFNFLKLKE